MTDLSPVIPNECDVIVIQERFVNEDFKFTGMEYKFIFKKRVSILGYEFNRTIKTDIIRSDLFLRPKDIELSGKPSFNEFEQFVKGWNVERKENGSWASVDHVYMKRFEAAL